MKRIALITYDISPLRGSEAAVSWNHVSHMCQYVEFTIIYGHYHEDIKEYLEGNTLPNVKWHHIPPGNLEGLSGLKLDLYYTKYYHQWHKNVYEYVKELVTRKKVDIIHYLNPIGFKEPGFCWKIREIPYLWGPIQGVDNRPLKLSWDLDKKFFFKAIIRRLLHNGAFIFHPQVRKALRNCDLVLAATPATVKGLRSHHNIVAEYIPEHSVQEPMREEPVSIGTDGILKMVWCGAIIDRKALEIALISLSSINSDKWHLDIIGDGPQRSYLQNKYISMADKITFHGKVSHQQAKLIMENSHLHLITSLGEASTTVLFEAMERAIPTITLDHCGMGGIVCGKCGIKIPLSSLKKVTDRIAYEIECIIRYPQKLTDLSLGLIECRKKFSWENRCKKFLSIYSNLK